MRMHKIVIIVFSVNQNCVSNASSCVAQGLSIGQYPLCSDCSVFVKCSGSASKAISCPGDLLYDVNVGVCNYPDEATCGYVYAEWFLYLNECPFHD